MKSQTTRDFRRLYASLPDDVQQRAIRAYHQWRKNPAHPGLQFKRISRSNPIYSARVGKDYRVVGLLRDDTVSWFWIGSHADYDSLIARNFGFSEEQSEYQVRSGPAAWREFPCIGRAKHKESPSHLVIKSTRLLAFC